MAVDGSKTNLMIVCGEPSGDELGARLVDEIRKIESEAMFFGATGAKMRAAGVETIVQSDDWPITGVAAVMRSIPAFYYRLRFLEAVADKRKPSAVILIDFPEFNLKLAKRLKKQGHTIIYYVSPQLWAWRKYRVRSIAKYVDLLLSILPFEKEWYSKQGVENVVYVGNPIAENVRPAMSRAEFCIKHGLDNRKPIIALLPGSRGKEIRYHLPLMLKA
ncbi:MAG: lipid-A-disaccharide synthase, partial [Pyrinomonadaceae bacterium]